MAQNITNFQYVGYLSDFLGTYNDIDALMEKYQNASSRLKQAAQKKDTYNQTFAWSNCALGWGIIAGALLVLFMPLVFLTKMSFLTLFVFCVILSCVIILISRAVYIKKVLPVHTSRLEAEINKAKTDGKAIYEALIAHRANLQAMKDGIDTKCAYPLSVYIMREAAKEGECSNIPQGVHYFTSRYKTLEEADDEESIKLKNSIDKEQDKAAQRQSFLDSLDETARELFE